MLVSSLVIINLHALHTMPAKTLIFFGYQTQVTICNAYHTFLIFPELIYRLLHLLSAIAVCLNVSNMSNPRTIHAVALSGGWAKTFDTNPLFMKFTLVFFYLPNSKSIG